MSMPILVRDSQWAFGQAFHKNFEKNESFGVAPLLVNLYQNIPRAVRKGIIRGVGNAVIFEHTDNIFRSPRDGGMLRHFTVVAHGL